MATKKTVSSTSLERHVLVRAPPEEVWKALAEPERLRVWFFEDAELELMEGGHFSFGGIEGNITATVLEATPNARLRLEFGPPWFGIVDILLSPTPTGTRVTLIHDGFEGREEWLLRFGWGWEAHLKNLKAFSEGKPIK
ncbi:MAG TPA: SRPBCC domain-containing protein [Candidatus Thermoplasmatota archaeon]|nr:SRPBCC domain-containing protein [Candidatus Thermoplasmatota archaeon]